MTIISLLITFVIALITILKAYLTEKENKQLRKKLGR